MLITVLGGVEHPAHFVPGLKKKQKQEFLLVRAACEPSCLQTLMRLGVINPENYRIMKVNKYKIESCTYLYYWFISLGL